MGQGCGGHPLGSSWSNAHPAQNSLPSLLVCTRLVLWTSRCGNTVCRPLRLRVLLLGAGVDADGRRILDPQGRPPLDQ